MLSNAKVDYAGRTVDLLMLKTVLNVPVLKERVGIDVSNVDGVPMIVSGVEKMVQRFALVFINAMGSARFRPDYGTNLVPQVSKGLVYNMATLEVEAAEANMLARTQVMAADDGEDTPDDERLVASEVVNLEFSRADARIKVSITLTTAAGNSYTYIIPVAVGVH